MHYAGGSPSESPHVKNALLHDETILRALDVAIRTGDRAALYERLRRASGLPGPRVNLPLVRAFAAEIARRGDAADALVVAMASLHEDVAPFGHVDEILPILGVAAIGARAASDAKTRRAFLEHLEEAACERTRFRVRDAVAASLVEIGVAVGRSFVDVLLRWAGDDQPFLALAVATAMADADLASALGAEACASLVGALIDRVAREHRAGRRHDAFRRLVKVLESTPATIAARHPIVADAIAEHAGDDEDVRLVLESTARALARRGLGDRAAKIDAALTKTKKPLRDPRHGRLIGKSRGRGRR